MKKLVDEAADQMQKGERSIQAAGSLKEREAIYEWSRAARAFTRSQVKALMVHDMLTPPASRPEDFNV
ncbi:MAG TPA: hypothetical protein VHT96_04510 [Clostridia bacterium]|nr:hypothetical protein [Clostridia bacterium]